LKRGIMGSFHKVSRKYLPRSVAEFQFSYNNRHNKDIFGAVNWRIIAPEDGEGQPVTHSSG
jgi:hypothetical protein